MSSVGFVETDVNNYLCVFSTANLISTERTIEELMNIGIGKAMGIAGICAIQFRRPNTNLKEENEENKQFKKSHSIKNNIGMTEGFYSSIKSRQIVDMLVDNTRQSAEFTYDYMIMLLVADIIATMGLATNSAVAVVASMLVSPIMGPVLALTLGIHLRKFKFGILLAKLGAKNEFGSLLICIIVGFIVGGILIIITENRENSYSGKPWPTDEMHARGDLYGLAIGAIVAFTSGVGVALSVVNDYMASIIGVAISGSLLPPAVNCGMLWAQSLYVWKYDGYDPKQLWQPGCNQNDCYTAFELAQMGIVSILLTIENIILIFIAGLVMFKIKDITPSKNR
eukprot:24582_1